jgi:hypothetical protein
LQQLNRHSDDSILYRLPTEAEREYAARAGTTTAWSFGDAPSDLIAYAWYRGNTCDGNANACFLHEVGLKRPNPWGLYDMHGNVSEWIEDWWIREYSQEPQINPILDEMPVSDNPDIFPERMIKGLKETLPIPSLLVSWRAGCSPGGPFVGVVESGKRRGGPPDEVGVGQPGGRRQGRKQKGRRDYTPTPPSTVSHQPASTIVRKVKFTRGL